MRHVIAHLYGRESRVMNYCLCQLSRLMPLKVLMFRKKMVRQPVDFRMATFDLAAGFNPSESEIRSCVDRLLNSGMIKFVDGAEDRLRSVFV